jgi:hypothetical protein
MAGSIRRPHDARAYLLLAALVQIAVLAWYEPLALLLGGPWVAAAAWAVLRKGLPSELGEVPSAAEEARRRLAVR